MDNILKIKYLRISQKKLKSFVRPFVGLNALKALDILSLEKDKAAAILHKGLKSALEDSVINKKLDRQALFIKALSCKKGPAFKRWRAVARGTAHKYKKYICHLDIILSQKENMQKVKKEKEVKPKKEIKKEEK